MLISEAQILFLDCQTTATHPKQGRIIEIGWAVGCASALENLPIRSSLVRLPDGETIPLKVRRMTGIEDEDLAQAPIEKEVWDGVLQKFSVRTHSQSR